MEINTKLYFKKSLIVGAKLLTQISEECVVKNVPTMPAIKLTILLYLRCKWQICSEECTNHVRHKPEYIVVSQV